MTGSSENHERPSGAVGGQLRVLTGVEAWYVYVVGEAMQKRIDPKVMPASSARIWGGACEAPQIIPRLCNCVSEV
jgi:hypothetical protein